eukprot:g32457.t1
MGTFGKSLTKLVLSLPVPLPLHVPRSQCHEFIDERSFSEACVTDSLGYTSSRSTSLSSHPGTSTSCCPCLKRQTNRLINSSIPVSRVGSVQELSTIHAPSANKPQ